MKKTSKTDSNGQPDEGDAIIYECFRSRMIKDGKVILLGSEESTQIKNDCVWRGFLTKKSKPRKKLRWLEELVIYLRTATTEAGYNHEWWSAEISKPEWVRNLDKKSPNCWLHFPNNPSDLTPAKIGRRLGYALTMIEYRMDKAVSSSSFLKQWESSELKEAGRNLEPEVAKKLRIIIPGYESFRKFAEDAKQNAREVRMEVMRLVEKQSIRDAHEFRESFAAGGKQALAVDIENPTTEFDRRTETFRILSEHWNEIGELRNRQDLCRFVASQFPERARKTLDEARETKKDTGTWHNFSEFIRDICDELGLKMARRGRPSKNTDF